MTIVFDRDLSISDGLSQNGLIRGLRIMRVKGPYPLMKMEIKAFEGRVNNSFQIFVWHPVNGWLEVISLDEKDFPFKVTDSSLETCFRHMQHVVAQIFAPEPISVQKVRPV